MGRTYRRPYSPAEIRFITEQAAANQSFVRIAAQLPGRTASAVSNFASLHNIRRLDAFSRPIKAAPIATPRATPAVPVIKPVKVAKDRPCLGPCGMMRWSTWAGDRVCSGCGGNGAAIEHADLSGGGV